MVDSFRGMRSAAPMSRLRRTSCLFLRLTELLALFTTTFTSFGAHGFQVTTMSKVVASLLCDFVVPVVGGSVFEALSTMATLCEQMKENEAVCRRVYDRLRFVWDELQKCTSAASLRENRVLVMYGSAIARFLEFLETHSRKRLLRRLMESSHVAECVRNFHEEIDELFKLLSIVHIAEMSAWHQEWERDRSFQRNMLKEVLSGACCEHGAISPTNTVDTLTWSTCSCSSTDDERVIEKLLHGGHDKHDFLDTEQRLVVSEKELEQTIRDHVEEYGYDVSGVLDLLRTLPSSHLALQGAAVLHELEMELQPEVLCLALPLFILEIIRTSAAKQDARFSIVRQKAEQYWFEWFPERVRALSEDHGVLFENVANQGLLCVSGNEIKLDSVWRRIITWTSTHSKWANDDLEIQWRLVPEDDNKTLFRLVNFRYPYEWLYATTMRCKEIKGASYALSTQPAIAHGCTKTAPEALWELQPVSLLNCSNGGFMLFNPHTRSYLCTADAMLDPQRRLALTVPKHGVGKRGLLSQQFCVWRLRTGGSYTTGLQEEIGQDETIKRTPKAALEIAALELVIRDKFETSGRDIGAVVGFLRKLPEAKHVLFGCSIARSLDLEISKNSPSRRDSLVLPFFVYELATTLPTKSRQLAQQYWFHWFSPVVKAIVLGNGLVLEDATSNYTKFLVAADNKQGVCERAVLSCGRRQKLTIGHASNPIPDTDELETQWKFEPVDDTFTTFYMGNIRYPFEDVLITENLDRAGGRAEFTNNVVTGQVDHRRSIMRSPTQHGTTDVTNKKRPAIWVLCDVGEDCFEIYHPEKRSYLCSTKEQLGKDRYFVQLSGDEGHATNRCWRFQSPLGLA